MMILILVFVLGACGNDATRNSGGTNGAAPAPAPAEQTKPEEPAKNVPDPEASHPVVTMEMDNGKIIKAELYPEMAPNTVNNFISLIESGFYDGLVFHRVMSGFMIQGGDPQGTGAGGPGYSIAGEFTSNGFANDLEHTRGVLSMARTGDPNSAGSQFFIVHGDSPHLDTDYAAFGKVTEGMEVVDEIAALPVATKTYRPFNPMPTLKKVTVDTLGIEYPEPVKE
ncbi:peptidylprolyl isomerase [Paenibacillus lemnae]|uniref:Peptidyl-prolyl cis-trans isomerase n=2 Tax=Paenibacillus lemnae TaxID=1330551 RepID=A0A848M4N8_PAELE|nr:peptidylprolyl isomerase [Paenibacillus lemnae]